MSEPGRPDQFDPRQGYAARRRHRPRLWPWLLLVTAIAAGMVAVAVFLPRWREQPPWPVARDAGYSGETATPGPRPARLGTAELRTEGRREFKGFARAVCRPHEGSGLHLALRTGVAELPVVVLVVENFDREGDYPGRLFLTARGPRGALVRSTGEAELTIEKQGRRGSRSLLGGRFEGSYAGAAGEGTLSGRFDRCPLAALQRRRISDSAVPG